MSVAVSKNISEILRAVDLKNPKLSTLASKGTDRVGKYAFSRRDCVPFLIKFFENLFYAKLFLNHLIYCFQVIAFII